MRICGSNKSFLESCSWFFEIFLTLYINYILSKFIRSKLRYLNKDYLDIILLSISSFQLSINILEFIFSSNFVFDFLIFMAKLHIVTLITGCLYFQILINKARFAVRYLKYYIILVLVLDFILSAMFFYQLFISEEFSFCYNSLFLLIIGVGVFLSGFLVIYGIYTSLYDTIKEDTSSFNLLCDEFYHLNLHIKKQLKTINKNQKYYFAILTICFISLLLDFISLIIGKNELINFKDAIKDNKTYSNVNYNSSIEYNSIDSSFYNNTNSESTLESEFIKYASCSMIGKLTDPIDILFCLLLYLMKDLLVSIVILLIGIIKPSNNESSQAFIDIE